MPELCALTAVKPAENNAQPGRLPAWPADSAKDFQFCASCACAALHQAVHHTFCTSA